MTATLIGPGGSVTVVDSDGDELEVNPDGSINVVGGGGAGGTEFAEDSAHASGALGTLALGIRNDAAAALTDANLDYSGLATDSAGRLGIADLGGAITVDAVDLDIRDLDSAFDSIETTQGTSPWVVGDGGGSITVDGTVAVIEPVSVDDNGGSLTTDGAFDNRFGGGLTPVTTTLTASGDTTIIAAPGVGQSIKIYWVSAITDPDQTTSPRIIIKDGAGTEYYRVVALAHWEIFTLPANTALIGNLETASKVEITVHYKIV